MRSIIGHESVRSYLSQCHAQGSFHHAYFFVGPKSVGKRAVAEWFVSLIHPTECLRIEREISDEGKMALCITVKQIRDTIALIQQTTFDGGRRIVIIDGIESLNDEASNALLKNLEEPPKNTIFILIAHDSGGVAGTILSRCCPIRFRLVSDKTITATIEHPNSQEIVRISCGRPGVAIHLTEDERFQKESGRKKNIRRLLGGSVAERLLAGNEWNDADTDALEHILRDELRMTQPQFSIVGLYHALMRTRQRSVSAGVSPIEHFFLSI